MISRSSLPQQGVPHSLERECSARFPLPKQGVMVHSLKWDSYLYLGGRRA